MSSDFGIHGDPGTDSTWVPRDDCSSEIAWFRSMKVKKSVRDSSGGWDSGAHTF